MKIGQFAVPAAVAGLGISASAPASAINFGAGQNFVSPAADVQPLAVVDKAYDFGDAGNLSINGVSFSNFNSQGADTFTGFGNTYNGYGNGGQSGDYGTLLSDGNWTDNNPSSITLNGLTSGTTYRIQLWVNDSRTCCQNRVDDFSGDAAGSDGLAKFWWSTSSGQYVIGSFVASGSSQLLNIDLGGSGTNNEQINGLLLSHVPEPASLGLLAIGGMGLLRRRRHGA